MALTPEVLLKHARVCRFDSYRDTKPEDLGRLSYDDLKPLEKHQTTESTDFLTPEILSGGDYCYSGSAEVSNHRVFLERYGSQPNVYDVYGVYGTFAVAIRLDSITPDMIKDLNGLEDYPLLDDEDHSKVEMEAEEESWELCVRSEFVKELQKKFPALEEKIEDLSYVRVSQIFYTLMDRTNTYWEHERGNNAYVRLNRVIEGATAEDILEAGSRELLLRGGRHYVS